MQNSVEHVTRLQRDGDAPAEVKSASRSFAKQSKRQPGAGGRAAGDRSGARGGRAPGAFSCLFQPPGSNAHRPPAAAAGGPAGRSDVPLLAKRRGAELARPMEQRTTDEWTIGLVTGHQSNKQQGYRQCCRGLPSCNETSCPGCCFVPPRLELPSTSKGFAALALVEGLAAVGFMIAMLAKTETNNSAAASFYAGMGIWFMSCFVYFAFDAIFSENKFQLAAADAMSLMATGYVILKYLCDEEVCGLGPFWEGAKLAVLIAKGGCSVLYLVATPFVLDNFGYSLFLLVGTDSHLISRYTAYLQTWTLLRFDFMLNLALIAMYGFFYKDGFEQLRNFDDFIGEPPAIICAIAPL
jgi:hypothetical protein